jgi:hypothetical protein
MRSSGVDQPVLDSNRNLGDSILEEYFSADREDPTTDDDYEVIARDSDASHDDKKADDQKTEQAAAQDRGQLLAQLALLELQSQATYEQQAAQTAEVQSRATATEAQSRAAVAAAQAQSNAAVAAAAEAQSKAAMVAAQARSMAATAAVAEAQSIAAKAGAEAQSRAAAVAVAEARAAAAAAGAEAQSMAAALEGARSSAQHAATEAKRAAEAEARLRIAATAAEQKTIAAQQENLDLSNRVRELTAVAASAEADRERLRAQIQESQRIASDEIQKAIQSRNLAEQLQADLNQKAAQFKCSTTLLQQKLQTLQQKSDAQLREIHLAHEKALTQAQLKAQEEKSSLIESREEKDRALALAQRTILEERQEKLHLIELEKQAKEESEKALARAELAATEERLGRLRTLDKAEQDMARQIDALKQQAAKQVEEAVAKAKEQAIKVIIPDDELKEIIKYFNYIPELDYQAAQALGKESLTEEDLQKTLAGRRCSEFKGLLQKYLQGESVQEDVLSGIKNYERGAMVGVKVALPSNLSSSSSVANNNRQRATGSFYALISYLVHDFCTPAPIGTFRRLMTRYQSVLQNSDYRNTLKKLADERRAREAAERKAYQARPAVAAASRQVDVNVSQQANMFKNARR